MSDIPKAYDPTAVEKKWTQRWLEAGAFRAKPQEGAETFAIAIPPPNVTGILHMGHILNNTIQDILCRRARLEGKAVLWQPGTDHAGIATQSRVEKELRKDSITRRDLGRERFLEKVWEWREKHGGIILQQLRELGASLDWDRTVFTMDEGYSQAVLTAFVTLFERGYIYQGKRMVNWCPVTQTALSDEEVIMKPQQGFLYKMRYEIAERPGEYVEISTTRPETLMGDTAVAFHPGDERYQHLKGLHAWRPFPRAEIPFITDAHVEREFGTGMLKVTPAHDPADFEIGQRHDLPVIDVLNPDGTLNDLAGTDFAGMDRFEARKKAAKKLEEMGLLVKAEPYENNVGFSERADVPIEPRLSQQWWMKYPRVEEAKAVVREGLVKFYPERWSKTYLHWLDNIQDWCISRQLWWGHRIPVWYRKGIDREKADITDPEQVHVSVKGPSDVENWIQEEDVLDTWASSWLWPFATLGWPQDKQMEELHLRDFYPTSVLSTGPDIIFFWVARMIMAGLEFADFNAEADPKKPLTKEQRAARIPFRDVYLHGIIRDDQGRKMSKSLGNSPDPLDLIAKFGADGLRFGLLSIAPKGQDILFSEDRIQLGRNFCNKLWNACRFRQMSGEVGDNGSLAAILQRIEFSRTDAYDRWILTRMLQTTASLEKAFATYEFTHLTQELYAFFWSSFCDVYLEVSKTRVQEGTPEEKASTLAVQDLVIRQVLLLLEPFCPFITEELWHLLGYGPADQLVQETRLMTADEVTEHLRQRGFAPAPEEAAQIDQLMELVTRSRSLKSEYNLATRRDVTLFVATDGNASALVADSIDALKRLIGAESIAAVTAPVEGAPGAVTSLGTVYLDLASAIDLEAETNRLTKELEKLNGAIRSGEAKLSNEKFMAKAPPQVVEGARAQLAETTAKRDEVQRLLDSFQAKTS